MVQATSTFPPDLWGIGGLLPEELVDVERKSVSGTCRRKIQFITSVTSSANVLFCNAIVKPCTGDDVPLYGILSHTWGEKEITFQDIEGHDAEKMVEYEKIKNTCDIAAAHGLDYVWIDTCCFDKKSSAELSEAINYMYRWYQNSAVCYTYLADMPPNAIDHGTSAGNFTFSECRWFTRGWTLQELIAPSTIILLNREWQEIGTKSSLQREISEITGIPTNILLGSELKTASVAQRMSWASMRKTTRVEDLAYSLMGIFGINMPLLYGEGARAFTRLQEEIMKISDDHSLFAWRSYGAPGALLATSPRRFSESGQIIPFNTSSKLSGAITVDNKGIHLKLQFSDSHRLAILPCTCSGKAVAIIFKALPDSKDYFVREKTHELRLIDPKEIKQFKLKTKIICVRQEQQIYRGLSSLQMVSSNGNEVLVKLLLERGAELETRDDNGQTPLFCAIRSGHEEVVKLLLERGAELAKD